MTVFTILVLCHFHNLASPFHKKAFVQGYRQGRFSYSRKFQYYMKYFMSYMLTQQADHSQERVAKSDNVGKSDSKFPSLLFPPVHFTRSNTDTFNTHNIVICIRNLVRILNNLDMPYRRRFTHLFFLHFYGSQFQVASAFQFNCCQFLSSVETTVHV